MPPVKRTGNLLLLITVIGMILDPRASRAAMATNDGAVIRLESNCTCIGHPLEFRCVTIGLGATIWRGSAFNCPSSLDKIQLYHSRFATGTAIGSCNGGNIFARALDTTEGQYRSQLNIHNLTPEMIGTTVECAYDNGTHVQTINNITISITAGTFPPPVNITLNIVSKGILYFSWNPVAPACPAIHYNVNTDKCGRCPMAVTNSTSVICTDVVVEDEELCNFGVSTVVCNSSGVAGLQNNLEVMLRVPSNISLSKIDVTPTYENTTSNLTKLTTGFNTIENDMMQSIANSSIISYTINYTDTNTGRSCGNGTLLATSCINGACSHEFQVKSSKCQPEANFTIKIYGTNALGNGRNSDPIRRDFTNHLVKVVAYPLRRMITCEFYHNSDSTKSCNATYFDEHCQNKLFAVNASNTGNSVNLHLFTIEHRERYCYVIAANNGTMEVNISGFIIYQTDADHNNIKVTDDDWIIAVSLTFPMIFVTMLTIFGILAIVFMHRPRSLRRFNVKLKRN